DAPLRVELRRQIRALAREFGGTVIHVTHDPAEALAAGDRVAVIQNGRILQIDEPRQLRRCPLHRGVAELIHHQMGGINWLTGHVAKDGFEPYFECPCGRWQISLQMLERLRESLYKGRSEKGLDFSAAKSAPIIAGKQEIFAPGNEKVDMMIGIPAAEVRSTT